MANETLLKQGNFSVRIEMCAERPNCSSGFENCDYTDIVACNGNQSGICLDKTCPLVVNDPESMKYPWLSNEFFYHNIVTYMLTVLFGVLGNAIVIAVMAGDRKTRSTTNVFLVSLAVADLLMLLLCAPLETVRMFVIQWDSGGAACTLADYFKMLSFTASVLNLSAVSLERFIVIVFPVRSRSLCTMSNCRRSVFFVWIISVILACPVIWVMEMETIVYIDQNNTVQVNAFYCRDMDSMLFLSYKVLVLFFIPAVLMIIFYMAVIRELWKSTKNFKSLTNSTKRQGSLLASGNSKSAEGLERYCLAVYKSSKKSGDSSGAPSGRSTPNCSSTLYVTSVGSPRIRTPSPCQRKKPFDRGEDVKKARKQVIKMLLVVVMLFLLCWGPTIAMQLIIGLGMQMFTPEFYMFKTIFALLPFIHCCINPIIYCFMSKNFRKSMSRVVGQSCCRKYCGVPQIPQQPTMMTRVATSRMSSSYSPDPATRNTDLESITAI